MEAYFSRMHWPCRKVRPKNASWCTKQLRKFVLLSVIYCSIKLDSHNEKNLPSCVQSWDNVMHNIYSQSMNQLYSHYPSLAKECLPSKECPSPTFGRVAHPIISGVFTTVPLAQWAPSHKHVCSYNYSCFMNMVNTYPNNWQFVNEATCMYAWCVQ